MIEVYVILCLGFGQERNVDDLTLNGIQNLTTYYFKG